MGDADQLCKQLFTEEVPLLAGGKALSFEVPAESPLIEVRPDGILTVLDRFALASLPAPWCLLADSYAAVLDNKMVGDHLGPLSLERLKLRRQVWLVHLLEKATKPGTVAVAAWTSSAYLPRWLRDPGPWRPRRVAPGCYLLEPEPFQLLWIATNELPLCDENIPLLVTRTGKAQAEFLRWVAGRKPLPWMLRVLELVPMPASLQEEIAQMLPPTDDPERLARRVRLARLFVDTTPGVREQLADELRPELVNEGKVLGQLVEARKALRQVLVVRGFALTPMQEATIDQCIELAALERWLRAAVVAPSVDDALR